MSGHDLESYFHVGDLAEDADGASPLDNMQRLSLESDSSANSYDTYTSMESVGSYDAIDSPTAVFSPAADTNDVGNKSTKRKRTMELTAKSLERENIIDCAVKVVENRETLQDIPKSYRRKVKSLVGVLTTENIQVKEKSKAHERRLRELLPPAPGDVLGRLRYTEEEKREEARKAKKAKAAEDKIHAQDKASEVRAKHKANYEVLMDIAQSEQDGWKSLKQEILKSACIILLGKDHKKKAERIAALQPAVTEELARRANGTDDADDNEEEPEYEEEDAEEFPHHQWPATVDYSDGEEDEEEERGEDMNQHEDQPEEDSDDAAMSVA